ncbi:MAG TPA: hypothetical protein VD864_15000 [Nocardioides sp.]|nr:hypothetical protein [Nocardioides sp.]
MSVTIRHVRTFPARTVGALWRVEFAALDDDGYPAGAPTLTITVTKPDGTTLTPAVEAVQLADERWRVEAPTAAAGWHTMKIASGDDAATTGTLVGAATAAVPTTADAIDYMGDSSSWGDADVADALQAELAAQETKCRIPAGWPADIKHALFRRVQRNLAMRNLPLGLTTPDADGQRDRVPGWDAEIRRLEGPYRRLPVA